MKNEIKEVLIMKSIIISIILSICYGNLYSQDIKKQSTVPASITNIEFICTRINNNLQKVVPPRAVIKPPVWNLELVFDINTTDTSFGRSISYDIAGILPDGKIFRRTVHLNYNVHPQERIIIKEKVDIYKLGWADFILTTSNTPSQLNLYNFDIRSNKYSVNIK